MENYIIVTHSERTTVSMSQKAADNLQKYKLKGCPFKNYTMLDLLKDWVSMYSWQIERNKKVLLIDFIKEIKTDGKWIYKKDMIELIKEAV
jgi:GTP-dependent phosphoenolpyruvate carboxykinase